jgi:hypothetical protein
MATSYTTLLGLALPVTGELSGTWGDTVNNYLTNYLDSAVAGALTVTGDTTLTKTTGSSLGSTSSQYAVIIASPASANITITAPAASKIYTIINTSGTYTVKIRGAGPTTGVTLAVNEKAQVAWNGSDFVKISSSSTFTDLTVTGNTILGDASTDTVTVNGYMGVGGAPSASKGLVLQNTVSASTPLGMDIRPTLTATAGSLLASFATGTAGSLTANTGASVSAYGCYLSEPNIVVTTGSVTNAATVFINEGPTEGGTLNANLYTNAATGTNKWNIYASGTADNYFAGNVGVGITGSSARLALSFSDATAYSASNMATGLAQYLYNSSATDSTSSTLLFGCNGTSTDAQAAISLVHTGAGNGALAFGTRNGGNVTERMRIDSSGNLGIGVTPSAWGSIVSPAIEFLNAGAISNYNSSGLPTLFVTSNAYHNGTNWIYKTSKPAVQYALTGNTGTHAWYTAPSGTAGNAITFTQAMTLDASGNLLIGVTSSTSSPTTGTAPNLDLGETGNAVINARAYGTGAGAAGVLTLGRSNSNVLGTLTATTSDQYFGIIGFEGVNTSGSLGNAAFIAASQDGTNGGVYVPGYLGFYTGTNAAGPLERMRITAAGNVVVTGTGGLGYGTGSGGTVTQLTSRTTGVTLNKTNGAITLVSAAGSTTFQSFTVTNSTVAATDVIRVVQKSGTDKYAIWVTAVAAGSFQITFATLSGTTTEQPVFNFAVIKAVTA